MDMQDMVRLLTELGDVLTKIGKSVRRGDTAEVAHGMVEDVADYG